MYSVARLYTDQSFFSLCHRRRVVGLSMLYKANTVCLASIHLLLLDFDISELWPQLIHWSLKCQGVKIPKLVGVSSRPWLEFRINFPKLCLIQER